MCAMIGQFSKSYFTVWPAKFKSLFEVNLPPLSECRDEINIWSVLFVWSVLSGLYFLACVHCFGHKCWWKSIGQ